MEYGSYLFLGKRTWTFVSRLQVMAFRDAENKWDNNGGANYTIPIPDLPPLPCEVVCADAVAPGVERKIIRRPTAVDVEVHLSWPMPGGGELLSVVKQLSNYYCAPCATALPLQAHCRQGCAGGQFRDPSAVAHWGINEWWYPERWMWPANTYDIGSPMAVETMLSNDGSLFRASFQERSRPSQLVRAPGRRTRGSKAEREQWPRE